MDIPYPITPATAATAGMKVANNPPNKAPRILPTVNGMAARDRYSELSLQLSIIHVLKGLLEMPLPAEFIIDDTKYQTGTMIPDFTGGMQIVRVPEYHKFLIITNRTSNRVWFTYTCDDTAKNNVRLSSSILAFRFVRIITDDEFRNSYGQKCESTRIQVEDIGEVQLRDIVCKSNYRYSHISRDMVDKKKHLIEDAGKPSLILRRKITLRRRYL